MCICVTIGDLSDTYLLSYRVKLDKLIHVLLYGNTAQNLDEDEANAMVFPLPSRKKITQKNFLDTSECPDLLRDMATALTPASREAAKTLSLFSDIEVFAYGIYTVALVSSVDQIPAALKLVPKAKRAKIKKELVDWFAAGYPGWGCAVCCFNNKDAKQATPIMIWYEPIDPDVLWQPAVDSHTGNVPDFKQYVKVDHWSMWASDDMPEGVGAWVSYSNKIPARLKRYLPPRVIGVHLEKMMPNGDIQMDIKDVRSGKIEKIQRVPPPGFGK